MTRPSPMVEPSRSPVPEFYRVVSAPDEIVPRSQTFACGGCGGSGQKREQRGVVRACGWCSGFGRLLRGPDGSESVWPVSVEAV